MRTLIAVGLLLVCTIAEAAYYSPNPPGGWRNNRPMTRNEYASKVVLDSITGKIIKTDNALTVPIGGKSISLAAAQRLTPAAARVAAMAIFAHPATRTALGISQWLGVGKLVWDEVEQAWITYERQAGEEISTGYKYSSPDKLPGQSFDTLSAVCSAAWGGSPSGEFGCTDSGGRYRSVHRIPDPTCPSGWIRTSDGCLSPDTYRPTKVDTPEEFADKLAPKPMPETVPFELPYPTHLPVEAPAINPSTDSEYPVSLPLWVPVGDPVPNLEYNPDLATEGKNLPFVVPGVRVLHSPTTEEPWRLDLQTLNRPVESQKVQTGPETEKLLPDGSPPNANDRPRSDTADLCEKHPDIVACQKLTEPERAELPEKDLEFELIPETGFAGGGSCPPPFSVTVGGRTLTFSWQGFCNSLTMVKPLLLAFAWLGAAFIVLGARQET